MWGQRASKFWEPLACETFQHYIYIYSIKVNAFQSIFLQQHSQGCFVFFLSGDFSIVDQVAGDEPDANPVLARGSSAGVGTHNSLLALTSKHIFFWEDIKT